LISNHAGEPMTPEQAEALWKTAPPGNLIKHVGAARAPESGWRLLETQARLQARFGEDA